MLKTNANAFINASRRRRNGSVCWSFCSQLWTYVKCLPFLQNKTYYVIWPHYVGAKSEPFYHRGNILEAWNRLDRNDPVNYILNEMSTFINTQLMELLSSQSYVPLTIKIKSTCPRCVVLYEFMSPQLQYLKIKSKHKNVTVFNA